MMLKGCLKKALEGRVTFGTALHRSVFLVVGETTDRRRRSPRWTARCDQSTRASQLWRFAATKAVAARGHTQGRSLDIARMWPYAALFLFIATGVDIGEGLRR
jgi:hypothetical protein